MLPASAYQPSGAVLYGATVDWTKPLGCDLPALPVARDSWLAMTLDPTLVPPDLPSDDSAPAIPNPGDGLYHGGRVVPSMVDVGAQLAQMQDAKQLAPRVVLHLAGKGEMLTSPIKLKGTSLVLYFEEQADKPALTLARPRTAVPLIDLDGGSLEVIGGVLRVPDQGNIRASHVVRVKGGDVRLYRTRLDGPQQSEPEGYVAALSVAGSGDPGADKGHVCAINESVILSSKACLVVEGVGCRVAMRQSLVVSGTEALHFLPGKGYKGKTGVQMQLMNVTLAGRRSIVHLGDAPTAIVPTDPILVHARECAYLNPFPGKPNKAGMLSWEGEAFSRGLLTWHGEREGFDNWLHYAASARGSISDNKEGYTPWKRLWGASGVREPREVSVGPVFVANRWALEKLAIKMRDAPGANLERLGIPPKKK
jgi:hypothetical protein